MRRAWWVRGCVAVPALGLIFLVDQMLRRPTPVAEIQPSQMPAERPVDPLATELTPQAILQCALEQWLAINDYRCTVTSANWRNARMENNVLEVMYKRPGLFKHTIVEGDNPGVVLIRDSGGKIQVRPGGLLGVMTVSMEPSDQRLRDGRGEPFYRTDWGSELARFDEARSLKRLNDEATGEWCLEYEEEGVRHHLWIDPRTHLPTRTASTRDGKVIRDARYSNIALNTGSPESEFNLR